MTQINQIYECLETDPLLYRNPEPSTPYTPWNHLDKQYFQLKPKLSQKTLKRSRTVSTSSRMRSTRRSDLDFIQKLPVKNNTYIFPLSTSKITGSILDKPKLSTPVIKQKRNLMHEKTDYQNQKRQNCFKTSAFTTRNSMFYQSQSCSLFLFKPKNTNPIEIRNRNIQLIRNIHHKKLFKPDYTRHSKFQ